MSTKKKREKLNKGLCPEGFEICVPKECGLLGVDWKEEADWKNYVKKLAKDHGLKEPNPLAYTCYSCDCKPGWRLKGDLAVAHACKVHDKIHRQVLGFEKVSAVDVGFAIQERKRDFGNFLAIRIHVSRKLPPEQLLTEGLPSFTQVGAAIGRRTFAPLAKDSGRREKETKAGEVCDRQQLRELRKLLKRELGGIKRIWRKFRSYPISGVRREDLAVICHEDLTKESTLDDIRLSVCGVPIDIINAQYNPSVFHPGGDSASGVFVDEPQRANQLSNDEQMLIGRGRVNPLVGGVSVGTITGQAGTLGTIVWDRTDGTPCLLSNWHVLAGNGTAQVDQPTYQPALFDGGTEDDVVAQLKRWTLGEEGDAAIAELIGTRYYAAGEILGMWHPISGSLAPALNMEIRKWGRTTGYSRGFVDGIHLATNIDYGSGVVRYFNNQFHIAPLFAGEDVSQVGDSGSLVLASFKPRDLTNDLAKLCEWLQYCCDSQGRGRLCAEIARDSKKLSAKCAEECESQRICGFLRLALKSINDNCTKGTLDNLCKRVERRLRKMKESCEATIECAEFCRRVSVFFRELHKLSRSSSVRLDHICCRIEEAEEELVCPATPECRVFCSAFDEAMNQLKEKCAAQKVCGVELCRVIREQRSILNGLSQKIVRCSEFCPEIVRVFEQWVERCKQIKRGAAECERLCEVLSKGCKDASCKDPSALVACVESSLRKGGSGQGEAPGGRRDVSKSFSLEFRNLLKSLGYDSEKGDWFVQGSQDELKKLGYDPTNDEDWFLQLMKANLSREDFLAAVIEQARAFVDKKEDEEARNATCVYYAVGLIFAGDTPRFSFRRVCCRVRHRGSLPEFEVLVATGLRTAEQLPRAASPSAARFPGEASGPYSFRLSTRHPSR